MLSRHESLNTPALLIGSIVALGIGMLVAGTPAGAACIVSIDVAATGERTGTHPHVFRCRSVGILETQAGGLVPVTVIRPSVRTPRIEDQPRRRERISRALGQGYTGFLKAYSGQRYAGFRKVWRGQRWLGFRKVYSGPRYPADLYADGGRW